MSERNSGNPVVVTATAARGSECSSAVSPKRGSTFLFECGTIVGAESEGTPTCQSTN